ncbi:sugar phosphate isomerase/epimerase [bacterium]|nr:sugar phosphate isomerase/epimerase [bacterium]
MKLGLDSYSYHLAFGRHADFTPKRKMTLPQFIDRVADLGLDGFQIDPMHLTARDEAALHKIAQHAQARGLFLEYGAMGLEPSYLSAELEVCAKLGSPVLRTFAHFSRYAKTTRIDQEIKRAIRSLHRVTRKAEQLGIRIAVENHGDFSADELVRVIKTVNSPWVGICLDLGNSMATMEDPLQAAAKMAPYAVTTHFKDHCVQLTYSGYSVNGCALGDGVIDLAAALRLLKEKTKLDRIILEIPCPAAATQKQTLEREEKMVSRSVAYARGILKIK